MDFGVIKAVSSNLLTKFKSKESLDDVRFELTRTHDQRFRDALSDEVNKAIRDFPKLCGATHKPEKTLKSIITNVNERCDKGQIQDVTPSTFKKIFEPLLTAVIEFYFSDRSKEVSFKGNDNDKVIYFVSPVLDNSKEAIFSYTAPDRASRTEVFMITLGENKATERVNMSPIVPVISNSPTEEKLDEQVQPTMQQQLRDESHIREQVFKKQLEQLQQQIALQAQQKQKKLSSSESVLQQKPTPVFSSSTEELQVLQKPNTQPTYQAIHQPTHQPIHQPISNPIMVTPTIPVNKNAEQKDFALKQPSQPSTKSSQPSLPPVTQGQYAQPVQQKVVQPQPQHNVSVPMGHAQPIVYAQPQVVQPVRYVQTPLSQSQPLMYVQPHVQPYGQQPPHVVQYVQPPMGHQQPQVVQQVVYQPYSVQTPNQLYYPTGY